MSRTQLTAIMLAGALVLAGTAWTQNDPIGKTDTVKLVVETINPAKWVITAYVWNDEDIAALDIPLKYTAGVAKLKVDSVSYVGTRMATFAQKYNQVDTLAQTMHFGGFAYVGSDKPPMQPGGGEVAKVYISAIGDKKPGAFAIDTTTVAPNNSLMLVDKNAKIITPVVKILTSDKGKQEQAGEKKN